LNENKLKINGCEIDKTRFVGMTNTLKIVISLDNLQSQYLLNSGWSSGDEISTGPLFNFSVPLKNLFRFAEDYKKVLLKCKHELVLMLTKNLGDVFEQTRNEQTFKLEMTNMENLSQITYLS